MDNITEKKRRKKPFKVYNRLKYMRSFNDILFCKQSSMTIDNHYTTDPSP